MAKKFRLFFKTKLSPVTVTFFEEVGVDDGGLTREAFSKVFATANREVLCGMENRFTLIHDKIKLEAGDFFIFGQMLSMALLMGASGPHNLSKPFAEHLLSFKEPKSYDIKDVPVAEVQEKLVGIKNCQTKEELDDCFASFDERFEAGYNKMVLNMDEREHFCRLISRFFIVERNHAEISQLLKGVHPDLLSLMRRFPEEGIKELVYTAKHIKASDITSNWIYDFSAPTSLKRKDENNIAFQWQQFLDELEDGQSRNVSYHPIGSPDDEIKTVKITIEDVLQFLTGSRFIPALGFGKKGTVSFPLTTDKTSGTSATTSTCFLWLKIPVSEKYTTDRFADSFSEDIVQSPGFGRL
ncbi:uncharacterized protein [Clytia hemisphaerica]|uniref:uncharacterized protein n=1 Tax=Clytia hemisphaerica TaxID=252671 RepID=UPI0034D64710